MPHQKIFMKKLSLLLLIAIFFAACKDMRPMEETLSSDTTTIYLVRHAEKDLTDKGEDPALTAEGLARAQRLAQEFKDIPLHAIYSTRYQRNLNTIRPLAEQKGLKAQQYEALAYDDLISDLFEKHEGQAVLISGHSNNLLPIIKFLGATPPQDSIAHDEYNKLFKVQLSAQDTTVLVSTY